MANPHKMYICDTETKIDAMKIANDNLFRPFMGQPSIFDGRKVKSAKRGRDAYGAYILVTWDDEPRTSRKKSKRQTVTG